MTPTPATNVTPFDQLTGVIVLQTANSGFVTSITPPQAVGVNPFGSGVRYQYNPQTKAIAVDNGPFSASFSAADIDARTPAGSVLYAKANGEQLILSQPAPGGIGLQWTRFIENTGNAPPNTRIIGVTGVPTPTAQIPTTGTITFTRTVVVGEAYVQNNGQVTFYSLSPSTLVASVNYATRRITFTLGLSGLATAGGGTTPLVTIAGTTDFDGASPTVAYTSSAYVQNVNFAIAAALFGTSGAEAGGVFVYWGTTADQRGIINLVGRLAAN